MSFGFAVGDFIAVRKLVRDTIKCPQSVGGAKSEYQELVLEFGILSKALEHIDQLDATDETMPAQLNYIKFAALSCRYTLLVFEKKLGAYNSSLGIRTQIDAMYNPP
ncbi:hypothetical protein G6011_09936 [Alternaria panax]|uniref:Uncharacterized protein n=1 Tax=Alternaria panax TaxID=48097 RepID=A0AAD4FDI5_9PLEO|nr:hypothetical protein G6011_09936 [Alternaria panax]